MDPVAAAEVWEVTNAPDSFSLALVDDEILGRKVFEIKKETGKGKKSAAVFSLRSKSPMSGAYVVEAWVRFPQESRDAKGVVQARATIKAALACGTLPDATAPAAAYVLDAGTGEDEFSWSGKRGTDAGVVGKIAPGFNVAKISPFSREATRLEMEAGLAAMPAPRQTWIPLRIEVGADLVRMYYNGALVLEGPRLEKADGPAELVIRGDARVARLEVRPMDKAASPFVRVPLDFRLNAAGPIDASALDRSRDSSVIQGVPFQLAGGPSANDHIDIGASVFRERMGTNYYSEASPEIHALAPASFDPNRIRLTIPMHSYARAWVLAGANDNPTRAPILTLRFYKPITDWSTNAAVTVPSFTAKAGGPNAKPVKIKTRNGEIVNLWLVPIELNTAELTANFRASTASIELTKEVKPYVAYPDPFVYSYHPAGLPSSVQVYGLTFEEAPVWAVATSDVKGGVYTAPEIPQWQVTVRNQSAKDLPVVVQVAVSDPYGKNAKPMEKKLTLKPGEEQIPSFAMPPAVHGLHTVRTTVSAGNWSQTREGTFLALPAISRKATALNSPWGVWTWNGTHGTMRGLENNARLLRALGAINQFPWSGHLDNEDKSSPAARNRDGESLTAFREKWGLGPTHMRLVGRGAPPWSTKNPPDPADYEAFKEEKGLALKAQVDAYPDLQYANCFAEDSVSLRLTHGVPAYAQGLPWFEYDATEKSRIGGLLAAANASAEGVKKYAPGVKFLFGHGAADFALPFFREKNWNPDLFAGFGLDMPQFERMPERQPRATEPTLLYFLHKEMKERGLEKKEIVHLESYFPPGHELGLGHRGQADSIVRTAVLSLALGTTKFMHTWSLQDCSDGWGSQHYGSPGLIGREPESNPKPAAAAFATMTRVLDTAKYSGWLETGSRSAFCVRFKDDDRLVYAVWSIRGTRPLEITADGDKASLVMIDENGNEFPLAKGKASVALTPTVLWIVARGGEIKTAQVGTPVYDEAPGANKVVLDNFDKGNWTYDAQPYDRYATNHWDVVREPVKMAQETVMSKERGSPVWRVSMTERPASKPCVGFYGVFTPPKPILIPGRAKALGIHAKGSSQWSRIIYELTDAKGEVWLSCGKKDVFNADDIHSRSYINHDGWRYMEFPLPASSPGDNYREKSCYSWGSVDDGIVDLPLTLNKVIVEMRTDMVYVDQMIPVDDLSVEFDDLVAVYDNADSMTDQPVKLQLATKDAWRPNLTASVLPNPIKKLQETGVGAAAVIEKVYPPDVNASGNQVYVKVKPVEGAQKYTIYVSAYPDGTGAQPTPIKAPEQDASVIFVKGLQPSISMYFFATYTDKDGKESLPSPARKTVLKDEFPFK